MIWMYINTLQVSLNDAPKLNLVEELQAIEGLVVDAVRSFHAATCVHQRHTIAA